jgi:hypothetical protein
MNILRTVPFVAIVALAACGGQPTEQPANPEPQVCRYTYNHDSTSVKWTAYKFTEKAGVSGTFDTVRVTGTAAEQMDWTMVFSNAVFSIPVSSINSTVPDRDMKIKQHFFGTMSATAALEGRVVSIGLDSARVEISMNGATVPVSMSVVNEANILKLEGVIDLGAWNALKSVNALNKVCYDLHKGADGVSKLWPEEKLEIRTVLTEQCD